MASVVASARVRCTMLLSDLAWDGSLTLSSDTRTSLWPVKVLMVVVMGLEAQRRRVRHEGCFRSEEVAASFGI
jgi:hypothetical protein